MLGKIILGISNKICDFISKILIGLLLYCSLLIQSTKTCVAATIKGIQFEDEITVDSQTLTVQGIGLLEWKYIVDVYLVALYKSKDIAIDKINTNIPKRLVYHFFGDMKAGDFQSTVFQLMPRNIGEEKAQGLTKELDEFNEFYQDVKEGQRYALTFLPGKGLEMALDGESLGVEFGSSSLTIWLGPDPVSKGLQKAMFDPSTKKQASYHLLETSSKAHTKKRG